MVKLGVHTMSQPQEGEHISKAVTENQYLPPLQKQILLYLAENQPQSKYSVKKGMKGYYKSIYDAVDDLTEKKILAEIKEEEYRNRKHSVYWLTPAGVLIALVQGASAKAVLNRTIEVYHDNKQLQCLVDLTTILGTDALQIGYQGILRKGKLERNDVSLMLGTMLLRELSLEQITDLIAIMKKYPEQFGDFRQQTDEAFDRVKKAELFLKDVFEKCDSAKSSET
jgi:Tfp pilus assembly ATPase PilU